MNPLKNMNKIKIIKNKIKYFYEKKKKNKKLIIIN